MAYKLKKAVAGAKSFRFNGNKYVTRNVTQDTLKKLFDSGFEYVSEIKESKKSNKNAKAKEDNSNENK